MKFARILFIIAVLALLVGCQPAPASAQEEPATWTMVLALVAPLVYSALQQSGFGEKINALIALGLCLLVSIADSYVFGGGWAGVTPDRISDVIYQVLTAAFISYEMIWKPFGLVGWIESRTDFKKPS